QSSLGPRRVGLAVCARRPLKLGFFQDRSRRQTTIGVVVLRLGIGAIIPRSVVPLSGLRMLRSPPTRAPSWRWAPHHLVPSCLIGSGLAQMVTGLAAILDAMPPVHGALDRRSEQSAAGDANHAGECCRLGWRFSASSPGCVSGSGW